MKKGIAYCLIFSVIAGFLYHPQSPVFKISHTEAAEGDITAVRIIEDTCTAGSSCNGWVAEIDIEGLSTGGTYDFGLGANNDPSTAKIVFTLTSPGFDTSGNATTISRTVYGVHPLRKPSPNNAEMDEVSDAGTLTVRVVLSDFIYSGDTDILVDIGAGFYTQGTVSSAVNDLSVTNNSTLSYQKPVSNWTSTSRTLLGDSLTVSMFGISGTAVNQKPLQAVEFYASDESGNTTSMVVTEMTKTSGMAVDFYHYEASLDTSSFVQGDTVTVNYRAYPYIGDAGSVFDTNDNAALAESASLPSPMFFLKSTDELFGKSYGFVDSVNGNDTTCVASTIENTARLSPCLSIARAERVVADYNLATFGRRNLANSIVYLQNGTYLSSGTSYNSAAYSATNDSVVFTLTKAPEASRESVVINTNPTTTFRGLVGKYIRITDITLTRDANVFIFTPQVTNVRLVVDNSVLNDEVTNTVSFFSTNFPNPDANNNIYNNANAASGRRFIGNRINTTARMGYVSTQVGNYIDTAGATNSGAILTESTNCAATSDGALMYNNVFYNTQDQLLNLASNCDWVIGFVFANNLVESNFVTGSGPVIAISADSSETSTNNMIIVHNSIAGSRANIAYNDAGTEATPQTNWSVKFNLFHYYPVKTDTFGANGNRTGNWPVRFGVSNIGNLNQRGVEDFLQEFPGIYSKTGNDSDGTLDPGYTNEQSGDDGAGNGDYHLTDNASALNLVPTGKAVLPYDIEGSARYNNGSGAAGAYEYIVSTYSIGGTISGLSGTVILRNNGGDDLSISSNGAFTFDTELEENDAYSVAVSTQPEDQTCSVINGSGTVSSSNITNISVICTDDEEPEPEGDESEELIAPSTSKTTSQENRIKNLINNNNSVDAVALLRQQIIELLTRLIALLQEELVKKQGV